MSKIHIGKKIREVLNKSHFTIVEFSKKINLTRDGVYKIFEKETIATDQLQKISKVLNHDFFIYYQNQLNILSDHSPKYGYAVKEDLEDLAKIVNALTKEIEKIREELEASNKTKKKKNK